MPLTREDIDRLRFEGESPALDFKRDQYPFAEATDPEKAELLKDVLAFANSWRDRDAHILIGLGGGSPAVVNGVAEHLPDADLQHVEDVAVETRGRLDGINSDPRHSEIGRADATSELGKRTKVDLIAFHEPIARGIAEHRAVIRRQQTAAFASERKSQDVGTRIEQALLRAEIRRAAAGLTPMGVEQLYRVGSPEIRAALEELPRIEVTSLGLPRVTSFVSDELRGTVLNEEAKRLRPDLIEQLDDLDLIEGALKACVGALVNALDGLIKIGTVQRVAAGGVGGDGIDTSRFVDPRDGKPIDATTIRRASAKPPSRA